MLLQTNRFSHVYSYVYSFWVILLSGVIMTYNVFLWTITLSLGALHKNVLWEVTYPGWTRLPPLDSWERLQQSPVTQKVEEAGMENGWMEVITM